MNLPHLKRTVFEMGVSYQMNGNAPTKKVGDTLFLRNFVGVIFIHYSRQQLIQR